MNQFFHDADPFRIFLHSFHLINCKKYANKATRIDLAKFNFYFSSVSLIERRSFRGSLGVEIVYCLDTRWSDLLQVPKMRPEIMDGELLGGVFSGCSPKDLPVVLIDQRSVAGVT